MCRKREVRHEKGREMRRVCRDEDGVCVGRMR